MGFTTWGSNNISTKQRKNTFLKNGLKENEFLIRSQKSGQEGENVNLQLVEIKRVD